jgi:hypothetical protein
MSLLDVPDSFSLRSIFHDNVHSMNVLYHFIFIADDSSQSFAFRNNGKSFICGFCLQLKQQLKFRRIFSTGVTVVSIHDPSIDTSLLVRGDAGHGCIMISLHMQAMYSIYSGKWAKRNKRHNNNNNNNNNTLYRSTVTSWEVLLLCHRYLI